LEQELWLGHLIGQMKETALHLEIKNWYSKPGDLLEHDVNGFIVDILRGDQIYEIQTGNFSKIKNKIRKLSKTHKLVIVYPVPVVRYIRRVEQETGVTLSRRKSPKKFSPLAVFGELVYLIQVIQDLKITFEILNVKDEIIYTNDGKGSWRRKGWSVSDRKLSSVEGKIVINQPLDFVHLLPEDLPAQFTTRILSKKGKIPIRLARQTTYCLYHLGLLQRSGKKGNAWLYSCV
jgi:hypothetical protein